MKEIFSVPEVSRMMGWGKQKIRERIKNGIWTFGDRIPKELTGNKRGDDYDIYRAKLEKHIGRKLTEEDFAKLK